MGEISYRKRGKKWEYRFEGAPINGKRNQISKGGFPTKAECIEAAEEAKRRYNMGGQKLISKEISVADYLDSWYDTYCTMNFKYNTLDSYSRLIRNYLKPKFGAYKLTALTNGGVQEYVYELKKRGLSKQTISKIISILSSAYEYAIEPLHYANQNPCIGIKYPKTKNQHAKGHYYIAAETYENILQIFNGKPHFQIPIMLGYHCGLRIGEAFGLTWDDVDFNSNTITIRQQFVSKPKNITRASSNSENNGRTSTSWYFSSLKTSASHRTISVDADMIAHLKKYYLSQQQNMRDYAEYYKEYYLKDEIDERGEHAQLLYSLPHSVPSDRPRIPLVMVRENGEYANTISFKYASRVIHEKINEPFDFHSLRHTHATMLAEAGANPEVVRRRLGHTDIKTTLQYYTHPTDTLEKDMMDKLEKMFAHK